MNASLLIAYAIAIAIPFFAVYIMFQFDLFGTGKGSSVAACLVWGGISVGLAYVVNSTILNYSDYGTVARVFGPIAEEILKSIMLLILITRPRFRYIVDGAVYGFASGIGFAVVENCFYLTTNPNAGLGLAISRALSTSLMHATTSALIGISLGYLRRSKSQQKVLLAIGGFGPAMITHIIFNTIVSDPNLNGAVLLLVAIGIGIGGFAIISYQIQRGVAEEKRRFGETLGIGIGVTDSERRAVQELGGTAIEQILEELSKYFGSDKADSIRRLLVLQANIGILRNNLGGDVSERLRKAWESEIDEKRLEMDKIRGELGVYIMSFVRGVFPDDDESVSDALKKEYTKFDPTQVHSFDMFINAGRVTRSLSPQRVAETADLLHAVDIFKQVSLADLENLGRAISSRTFSAGQLIFEQGAVGDTMYIVEEGEIQIFVKDGDREKPISVCHAGELVGELALLDGSPRSASARASASGELKVLELRREHFMMFVRSRPGAILALLEYLAKRARRLSEAVEASVEWASKIAQGDYEGAQAISGYMMPAGAIAEPGMSRKSLRTSAVMRNVPMDEADEDEEETGALPDERLLRTSGVFAKMSSVLDQRDVDKALGEKGMGGRSVPSMPRITPPPPPRPERAPALPFPVIRDTEDLKPVAPPPRPVDPLTAPAASIAPESTTPKPPPSPSAAPSAPKPPPPPNRNRPPAPSAAPAPLGRPAMGGLFARVGATESTPLEGDNKPKVDFKINIPDNSPHADSPKKDEGKPPTPSIPPTTEDRS